MIEKLPFTEIHTGGEDMVDRVEFRPVSPYEMQHKINELCDIINTIQKEREAERFEIQEWIGILEAVRESVNVHEKQIDESQATISKMEKVETCAENALIKTLRMDKEFAEDECVRLQNELGRTKRALEIAVKHLREITDVGGWVSVFSEQEIAQQALEQITTITKGGDNE